VPNSVNENHVSAEKQGKLVGDLSNLLSIQCQKTNENEELNTKLIAENQKLADRLTEQLQHEITKITDAIWQLKGETRH
jgi:hypothetical protein